MTERAHDPAHTAAAPRLHPLNWTWLVLPVGLALSWAAFHFAQGAADRVARYRFDAAAREAAHSVDLEMRGYAQVMHALQALFSANAATTRDEFTRYLTSLDLPARYPAIDAVNFARYVTAAQRDAYERAMREDRSRNPAGQPGFTIRDALGAPARRDLPWHFVVEYYHPEAPVPASGFGIDLGALPVRHPAAVQLVESGQIVSSGLPITLVSRRLGTNVLPMRLAVYRHGMPLHTTAQRWQAVVGSVGAYFKPRPMFDHALKAAARRLRLRVYDIGDAAAPADPRTAQAMLLYDNSLPDQHMAERARIVHDATMERMSAVSWAGRRWTLQFSAPAAAFMTSADAQLPWIIGAGGLVTTALVFFWLQALARSRAHAMAARRAQSMFLTTVNHELRTPLNAILGYAQLLGLATNLEPRQREALATIRASGDHLLSLIDDMLDLARVEAGRFELYCTRFPLPPFLHGVADIVRVRANAKQLEFVLELAGDLPATMQADERRLRQVLLNLLGNALKFTDFGRVCLRVRRIVPAPGSLAAERLRFEVQDSGIGIAPHQLPQLFRPFGQVGATERRQGGTGLGLAISREMVRRMGGDIEVHSEPGRGSMFAFELAVAV